MGLLSINRKSICSLARENIKNYIRILKIDKISPNTVLTNANPC